MSEEWRDIPGYEGKYQVSNMGNVRALYYKKAQKLNPRILIPRVGKCGYLYVVLSKEGKVKTFKNHRLVAQAFIPNNENKPQVNHKDGDKNNNCVYNLEWVTALENNLHAINVLGKNFARWHKFDKNEKSKKVAQYYMDEEGYRYKIAVYANAQAAAIINNLHVSRIKACCRGDQYARQSGGYIWCYED